MIAVLKDRLGLRAVRVGDVVRLEEPRGHELVPRVIEALPNQVEAISVGRPTLEDAFVHLSGRAFGQPERDAGGERAAT